MSFTFSIRFCSENRTIIDNNGTIETHDNGDMFWALRGGGGGTFGVTVHFVLKLHPAPTSIISTLIASPLDPNMNNQDVTELF